MPKKSRLIIRLRRNLKYEVRTSSITRLAALIILSRRNPEGCITENVYKNDKQVPWPVIAHSSTSHFGIGNLGGSFFHTLGCSGNSATEGTAFTIIECPGLHEALELLESEEVGSATA